jgi:hypothetical protein
MRRTCRDVAVNWNTWLRFLSLQKVMSWVKTQNFPNTNAPSNISWSPQLVRYRTIHLAWPLYNDTMWVQNGIYNQKCCALHTFKTTFHGAHFIEQLIIVWSINPQIHRPLCNEKFHYHAHKSPSLVPDQSRRTQSTPPQRSSSLISSFNLLLYILNGLFPVWLQNKIVCISHTFHSRHMPHHRSLNGILVHFKKSHLELCHYCIQ